MHGYVIQIIGLANGRSTPAEGQYIRRYTPPIEGFVRGSLDTAEEPGGALVFETPEEAHAYWNQAHGKRPDGEPNRELTAFSVEIKPLE